MSTKTTFLGATNLKRYEKYLKDLNKIKSTKDLKRRGLTQQDYLVLADKNNLYKLKQFSYMTVTNNSQNLIKYITKFFDVLKVDGNITVIGTSEIVKL